METGMRGTRGAVPGGATRVPPGDKVPKRKAPAGGRKRRKKKKGSEDEAFEDSDDGDFEGQEVDYMSDASRLGRGGPQNVPQMSPDVPKYPHPPPAAARRRKKRPRPR